MPNNLTDAEENRALDLILIDGDLLALMSVIGTDAAAGTEVTGGSYARQAIDWASAAGGSKANAAAINYAGMPDIDVQGWAVYDSTGTNRKWYGLIAPQTVAATAATDLLTKAGHGYADGQKVVFLTGYAPAGLVASTTYYVRDSTTSTFKVAATLGGAALDITADLAAASIGKVADVDAGGGLLVDVGKLVCSLS